MIDIKILGYHSAQRFSVRQIVVAVQRDLLNEYPDLKMTNTEVLDWVQIKQYPSVISAPRLLVNEKLECVGRNPSKPEVLGWLRTAIKVESGKRFYLDL